MDSPELLASLDRHFAAGCPALSTSQLREHEATGVCGECRERARKAARRQVKSGTGPAPEGQ